MVPLQIAIDSREPWPHPWAPYWPGVTVVRATLDTGDIALSANLDVAIERKTASDMVSCITSERDRFERELRRAACCCDSFAVVISASLEDLLSQRRGLHPNAALGTLAAWSRRYRHPLFFAGNDQLAAEFTLRFLTQPAREAKRLLTTSGRAAVVAIADVPF